jgi:hypothetical protein
VKKNKPNDGSQNALLLHPTIENTKLIDLMNRCDTNILCCCDKSPQTLLQEERKNASVT